MDFESALQYLDSFTNYEKTPAADYNEESFSLKRLKECLEDFSIDYSGVKFVHVAGSKGKGSVCSLIAQYLWNVKGAEPVGLFTSPHILDIRERIVLNGEMVSKGDFAACISSLKTELEEAGGKYGLTYFELLFVAAIKLFVEKGCEYVVLETGLGGRLDATNIVEPILSVLTSVELEHTEILGNSLEDIVREKLGIKKEGVPILIGYQSEEAKEVIYDQLKGVKDAYFMYDGLENVELQNKKLALTALRFFLKELDEDLFFQIVDNKFLPGRLDLRFINGKKVLFDMAHTVKSGQALKRFLLDNFSDQSFLFYFSMLKGKKLREFCDIFGDLDLRVSCVCCHEDRGLEVAEMEAVWQELLGSESVLKADFAQLLEQTKRDQVLVVTGSHFLVAEVLSNL